MNPNIEITQGGPQIFLGRFKNGFQTKRSLCFFLKPRLKKKSMKIIETSVQNSAWGSENFKPCQSIGYT